VSLGFSWVLLPFPHSVIPTGAAAPYAAAEWRDLSSIPAQRPPVFLTRSDKDRRRTSTPASCVHGLRALCGSSAPSAVIFLFRVPTRRAHLWVSAPSAQQYQKQKPPTRGLPFLTKMSKTASLLCIRRTLRRIIRRRINPRRHLVPAAPHRHHLRLFLLRLLLFAISCVFISHTRRLSHLATNCQPIPS